MHNSLELPLMENGNIQSTIQSDRSKPNIDIVLTSQNDRSIKHNKIHFRATIIQYTVLFIIAVAYTSYGINQLNDAMDHPISKFYQESTLRYPLPATMHCAPFEQNDKTYFNIINGRFNNYSDTICESDHCQGYIKDVNSIKSLRTDTTQVIHGYTSFDDRKMECFMVIPPVNATYTFVYSMKFLFWWDGYLDPDPSLPDMYTLPKFITNQEVYYFFHTAFNMDDFIEQTKFVNNDYSNILYDAFLFGNSFYSSLFTYNSLLLTLVKKIDVNGDSLDSFDVQSNSHLVSVSNYSMPNCTDYINDLCSIEWIEYEPLPNGDSFIVQYNKQYANYVFTDLLSGLGGIVSGANGVLLTISSFILFGLQIGCINWGGLAPHPDFDDNFKERLRILLAEEKGNLET